MRIPIRLTLGEETAIGLIVGAMLTIAVTVAVFVAAAYLAGI